MKTYLTEDEYADFEERLSHFDMSRAEFIRQAIGKAVIRPIIQVSPINDELLSEIGKLTAQYGKIGSNMNQIARFLNEYGAPYEGMVSEIRTALSDLANLKYEVLKKAGEALGSTETYKL